MQRRLSQIHIQLEFHHQPQDQEVIVLNGE